MPRPGYLPSIGLVAALLLTGCADDPAVATPSATQLCGPVAFPPLQFGSHLLGDAQPPVPYSSVPPSSGWHAAGAPPTGVFSEPLSEPAQVLALEAGGVVVTYNDLDATDLQTLEDLATGELADRLVVTPYAAIDEGAMVMSSWGAQQRCDGLDRAALDTYVAAYGNDMSTFEETPDNG